MEKTIEKAIVIIREWILDFEQTGDTMNSIGFHKKSIEELQKYNCIKNTEMIKHIKGSILFSPLSSIKNEAKLLLKLCELQNN